MVRQDLHNPLKISLIGCGKIAHSYATAIHGHPMMELSAVVDENTEAARAFGISFNCPFHTSLKEYLSRGEAADLAVICAQPSRHLEIACSLMKKGTNILCEIPFAPDSVAAEKMIDISRTFGVQLMMGSRFRYITDIIHTRGLIQSGILGRILVFEIDFRDAFDSANQKRALWDNGYGGILMDGGIHAIDIARYFFGPLMRIRAEEAQRLPMQDVEDTVKLDMRTVSGVIGTAQLSWAIKNACDDYIRIYGTQGTLCVGWKKSMYRLNGFVDWIRFGEGYSTLKALTRQMENLIDGIEGDGIPEITVEDGRESVRALEAAYKSFSTGNWVDLNPASLEIVPPPLERNLRVLRPDRLSSTKL
ncbi:MAG: Gfo/Idh/MocA family oxidoreductase [Acidobacteria bacterium]|nr:Gfo/Idh/MocA family oxidoreductase [Acidobacteriota bacterium]